MNLRAAILIALMSLFAPFLADTSQAADGPTISLRSDSAYVLVRVAGKNCGFLNCFPIFPFFIRTLNADELTQAALLAREDPDHWKDNVGPNVVVPSADQPLEENGSERLYLLSLAPGTYILGGLAIPNLVIASFCMGTVKFEAKPGTITDLGTIVTTRDDRPTAVPELSNYVTGKTLGDGIAPYAAAILRTGVTDLPIALRSLPVVSADYRAVSAFPNYVGAPLMRLAPLVGVLAYGSDGRVVDPKP
ncbi:MAG: hypothetical protein JSR60_14435 [Proteobacteria bacterium]|nr:hypothetical protein [Pseudomonadota bacterium]